MTFSERLERRVAQAGNPICFGMDPVLKRMPAASTPEETVRSFYLSIFEEMDRRNVYPAAVKPNSAYYEQISLEAMFVLRELVAEARKRGIVVVKPMTENGGEQTEIPADKVQEFILSASKGEKK